MIGTGIRIGIGSGGLGRIIPPVIADVTTQAELITALGSAVADDVITFAPTGANEVWSLSAIAAPGVTVQQVGGQPLKGISVDNVQGITFADTTFYYDNSAGTDWEVVGYATQLAAITGGSDISFLRCAFSSPSSTTKKKRFGGIKSDVSTVSAIDCDFSDLRDAIIVNRGTATTITGNRFRRLYEDAITGGDTDWLAVDDNQFSLFQGDTGKQHVGTITGTIAVGDLLTNGLTGTAQKVTRVQEVFADRLNVFYNNYNAPSVGETYTGPNGSIEVTSITTDFDGIHGDAFQPLNNTATADRILRFRNNVVSRETAYVFDDLGDEQNAQGLLAQDNSKPAPDPAAHGFGWSEIDASGNIVMGGQAIAFVVHRAKSGRMINNTFGSAQFGNPGRMRIKDSTNITLFKNYGNNGLGGVISDDGGNTGLVLTDNIVLSSTSSELNAPYTYPQTIVGLSPVSGNAAAVAGAGATDPAGAFLPLVDPAPVASPGIIGTAVEAGVTTASSITQAYTAPAGTNRRVLVSAAAFDNPKELTNLSATWGGVAMTRLATTLSDTSPAFDTQVLFELAEASWPASGTGNVVVTADLGIASSIMVVINTVENIGAAAPVVVPFGAPNGVCTLDITPNVAGSLVLAFARPSSDVSSVADFTAGVTRVGNRYLYGGRTHFYGSAIHGTTPLTITTNTGTTVRKTMIAAAFPPA